MNSFLRKRSLREEQVCSSRRVESAWKGSTRVMIYGSNDPEVNTTGPLTRGTGVFGVGGSTKET